MNRTAFLLLCSGLGLRQTARLVQMTPRNLEMKFRKIGRHCRRLNRNLRWQLPERSSLVFDELETYEGRRNTRPLTVPLLIERTSRLMVAQRAAPIRPSGKMTPKRLSAVARDEERFGPRPSRSAAAVRSVLKVGSMVSRTLSIVFLDSDEKTTYPSLAKHAFGDRLRHSTTSSLVARGTWNPLFPINHAEAMARDLIGRLRRESWLVSKHRWFLNLQLEIYAAYRNFTRPRFNRDRKTPAELVGWMKRRLRIGEVLSWRQDFGDMSGHPTSRQARAVADAA
ncbi:MAG: hypothetical protein AAFY46_11130 [Planctomycetota bacterium]